MNVIGMVGQQLVGTEKRQAARKLALDLLLCAGFVQVASEGVGSRSAAILRASPARCSASTRSLISRATASASRLLRFLVVRRCRLPPTWNSV